MTTAATDPMGQAKRGGLGHCSLSNKIHISTTLAGTPNDRPVYENAGDNTHLISQMPPLIWHGTFTYKWQLSDKFTLVTLSHQSQKGCCLLAEDYNLPWTDTQVLLPVCWASGGNQDKCTVQVEATRIQCASPPTRLGNRVDVTGLSHLRTTREPGMMPPSCKAKPADRVRGNLVR